MITYRTSAREYAVCRIFKNINKQTKNNQLDKKSKYDKRRLKQTTIKAHAKTNEHQDETLDKQLVNNNRQIEARKPTTEAETAKR